MATRAEEHARRAALGPVYSAAETMVPWDGPTGAVAGPGAASGRVPPWLHPAYSGSDPAYAAWLAQADLQSADAISQAKLRYAQDEEAYRQALADLDRQALGGRRQIQSNMLSRGIFHSGENDQRKQEYDALITQGQLRAGTALTNAHGQTDEAQRAAMSNLGTQAATQVSQAMLRDALAAYNAQQAQSAVAQGAAPAPTAQPQAQPAANFNPTVPAVPNYNPVTNSASLFQAQSKPKPKPASGSTGSLVLKKSGLQ